MGFESSNESDVRQWIVIKRLFTKSAAVNLTFLNSHDTTIEIALTDLRFATICYLSRAEHGFHF